MQAQPSLYQDPSAPIADRVRHLLSLLTLEEKIGQLLLYSVDLSKNINAEGAGRPLAWYREHHVGNLLNVIDEDLVTLRREVGGRHRLGIPLLAMIDAINGHAFYPGTTIFPSSLGLSCSWNPELLYEIGQVTAREMVATGIHLTYAPGLDIARDPRWGRTGETLGEDPYLVGRLGVARVRGLQGERLSDPGSVAACVKHLVGYGETIGGRDATANLLSQRHLRTMHLPPFKAAIQEGKVATVMAGYHAVQGVPVSANGWLLNDLLRKEYGFAGFVISDWQNFSRLLDTHRVSADPTEAAVDMLTAGNDMPMEAYEFPEALLAALKAGRVEEALIDEACARVLTLKFELGLFDNPEKLNASQEEKEKILACPEHQALALESACQSIVLLENRNDLLPLSADRLQRIAVIGPNADNIVDQLGDWSLGFRGQGKWRMEVEERTAGHVTILEGIRRRVGDQVGITYVKGSDPVDPTFDEISPAVAAARSSDLVIAVVGDGRELVGEHLDRATLELTGRQLDMLKAVKSTGKPLLVVLLASKPLIINWVADNADAFLVAFNPGMKGGAALAGLLFGDRTPAGKLTISFPHHPGQLPVAYNQPPGWHGEGHYVDLGPETRRPRYSFGYGLSYTRFAYSDLVLAATDLADGQSLRGRFTVTNTGRRAGVEIAQLYLEDKVASVVRPPYRLVGFHRLDLAAGESRTVDFEIPFLSLAILDRKLNWMVEPGEFVIYAGGSSRLEDLTLGEVFGVGHRA